MQTPIRFTLEPMHRILALLETEIAAKKAGDIVECDVLDPDRGGDRFTGEPVEIEGQTFLHRGYRAWTDLAELLSCRLLTPERIGGHMVRLRFQKRNLSDSFHRSAVTETTEKYGTASRFFAIDKNEEPAFASAYIRALRSVDIDAVKRVLDLGINTGGEFDMIRTLVGDERFARMELIGIDHSASAVAYAEKKFRESNVMLHCHDINTIGSLTPGVFDLIISIGTLQSSGIDFKQLLMALVQEYLDREHGALILGFPNCRWIGGEMVYGAKAPNYPYPEASLLFKDVHYAKKYLQQKKFRVTLTGKGYLFLTATRIGKTGRSRRADPNAL